MKKWTKETAISQLKAFIDEISSLKGFKRLSAEHTRWLMGTLGFLKEIFGQSSEYYVSINSLTWQQTGTIIFGGPGDPAGVGNPAAAIERRHQQAYLDQLDTAKGVLMAGLDNLERSKLEDVYQEKNMRSESSALFKILNILEKKLRKVIRNKPEAEKEIQEAIENLLIATDISYVREGESIDYSSKKYIPDFTISKLDLIIEVKLCATKQKEKDLIAEINDDILAYQTKHGNIIFVVYDCGFIRDIEKFSAIFEKNENVIVRVVKH
ncbi:MAG: hypothetical protein KAJ70_03190 [Candidatus Omnitrophica bacterium]|nr:hypothetical protein [Candidatus Omnitrophota bacterium]